MEFDWEQPLKSLNVLIEDVDIKYGLWGHFVVRNDSIYIQYFYEDHNNFRKRNIIEQIGLVGGTSEVSIILERCDWCKGKYLQYENSSLIKYSPPRQYLRIETDFKPDSSYVWFKRKKWYKKSVWRNEKNKN
jgi:hypothetical protein